ncbi:hypothetical protein [Acaryochloris marina]|uniref:Uncharacterized protein n=1 Tax=Acaryochloris marina (strain MBIC 11017) TaxID=329726 RepID=A8ZQF7_ACAM1|nr:hypothetical protein [Acaryochloris marina]ABW33243.1 hypothetical protein AM1_G0063 [Acaryochloris marina MBIC11017]
MPLYPTIAVVFIVFAVLLIIIRGVFADLTPLGGLMACTVLTLFAGYHRIFAGADQLAGVDSFFTLGFGLIICQLFVPDFRFWWSDFRFIYGMTVLFYFAFCWTFDHVYILWFWFTGFVLLLLAVQLLFSAVSSGGRPPLHPDLDKDFMLYEDEWLFDDD